MSNRVCVVGLGYVGLPLAHGLAEAGYAVSGMDINAKRIEQLCAGVDATGELEEDQLKAVSIDFTTDPVCIKDAEIVILAIPTPVDAQNKPDLTLLKTATEMVGKHLTKGAIVVYESTVYPGTTEEICGPLLEKVSGMKCGEDFTLGYSPERINPGDKEHTVRNIVKIVAGQDEKTTDALCDVYGAVVTAGIHRAPSIQVAEMAKAIENAQRDLNIAFVNEIAMLCNKIGIPTKDVLEAAGTKWNFLPFQPGLVGGHCIGVDPYYLVEKAAQLRMDTQVIAAGRTINDGMASYVAAQIDATLGSGEKRILILGLTFKENVPDTRNAKAGAVAEHLTDLGNKVEVHDAQIDENMIREMGFVPGSLDGGPYDAIALLVPHQEYINATKNIIHATEKGGVIYDLKSVLDKKVVEESGRKYLAL
ncbi:nucleotide sugar dehydrogenase [Candidatus Peregrinibacteria bacterium CG10_big_fil_rev_8_21_14_0_10_49_10]|nr:MAG: nucleotide sugar dehydrogenase [Candidatus Peregrinibacteria bacterium CG10_big_fil_rev_8_21_14_0_10_49_10]